MSRAAKNPSSPERLGLSPHKWQGNVRRSPDGVRHSARPPISCGAIGKRRNVGIAAQDRRDLRFALFGFERAGAVDEEAARPRQRDRLLEKLGLQLDERGEIARPLDPGDVGMAADRAGRGAGRVQQHGVERRRLEAQRVGDHDLGAKAQALEIGGKHLEPLGRAIDRRHVGAGGRKLRGLSARGGAEVGDAHARTRSKQLRRQRGGGVLHPPFAVGVTFELGDRFMGVEANGAGRQNDSAEPLGPAGRVAFDAEVERRL